MTQNARPVRTCGSLRSTGSQVYSCIAQPHPEAPDKHYFALDTEAYVAEDRTGNSHLEGAHETYFRTEVRKLGGIAMKLTPISKGTPDRLVVFPGGVFFVELKQTSGKASAAQELWHSRLTALGQQVAVLHGREEIRQWLASITEAAGPRFRRSPGDSVD